MLESIAATDFDLTTEAGLTDYGHALCVGLKKAFEAQGRLPTGAVLIATLGPNQVPLSSPGVIAVFDESPTPRRAFATALREMILEYRATGVFFFAEAWSVDFESEEERSVWRGRDWGKHPKATERIHCNFEHLEFQALVWDGGITRDASGVGVVGSFECRRPPEIRGTFTNFLREAKAAASNAN